MLFKGRHAYTIWHHALVNYHTVPWWTTTQCEGVQVRVRGPVREALGVLRGQSRVYPLIDVGSASLHNCLSFLFTPCEFRVEGQGCRLLVLRPNRATLKDHDHDIMVWFIMVHLWTNGLIRQARTPATNTTANVCTQYKVPGLLRSKSYL